MNKILHVLTLITVITGSIVSIPVEAVNPSTASAAASAVGSRSAEQIVAATKAKIAEEASAEAAKKVATMATTTGAAATQKAAQKALTVSPSILRNLSKSFTWKNGLMYGGLAALAYYGYRWIQHNWLLSSIENILTNATVGSQRFAENGSFRIYGLSSEEFTAYLTKYKDEAIAKDGDHSNRPHYFKFRESTKIRLDAEKHEILIFLKQISSLSNATYFVKHIIKNLISDRVLESNEPLRSDVLTDHFFNETTLTGNSKNLTYASLGILEKEFKRIPKPQTTLINRFIYFPSYNPFEMELAPQYLRAFNLYYDLCIRYARIICYEKQYSRILS